VAPRVRRSRTVLSGQDRCATSTARPAITFSVLERVAKCPCPRRGRARVSLNRAEIDDMPTRLDHDRDWGRIVLPQGLSTRRAILQGPRQRPHGSRSARRPRATEGREVTHALRRQAQRSTTMRSLPWQFRRRASRLMRASARRRRGSDAPTSPSCPPSRRSD